MLRIQRNDVLIHRVVLVLQGFIVGEGADRLERECAELLRSGDPIVIDLSAVSLIGDSGIEVLRRVHDLGIRIVGCSPSIAEVLENEGIEVERKGSNGTQAQPRENRGFN